MRSWSNWTDFYDHAKVRNRRFAHEELSFASRSNSSIGWLMLISNDSKVIELIEVPKTDGSTLLTNTGSLYSRADAALYSAKENGRNRVPVEASPDASSIG